MSHSKDYLTELQKLHSKKTFGTAASLPLEVEQLIQEKNIKSVLDFGAGKGNTSTTIKEKFPNIDLYTYDPVTFPISLPSSVDLIYSSDVLEHVEPDLIDNTLLDLFKRATRYQYHLIACHPAKKSLSDGRNAHLIVESPNWWKQKLQSIQNWKIIFEDKREYTAQVKKGPPREVVKYIVILEKLQ